MPRASASSSRSSGRTSATPTFSTAPTGPFVLRDVGDVRPAASLKQAVEHQALVGMMAERAGVRTPPIHRIVEGRRRLGDVGDGLRRRIIARRSVRRAADRRTAPASSGARSIVCIASASPTARCGPRTSWSTTEARPWIVDFSFSEVAASRARDRARRRRAARVTGDQSRRRSGLSTARLRGSVRRLWRSAVPMLQPLALSASTRRAVSRGDKLFGDARAPPHPRPVVCPKNWRRSVGYGRGRSS